MRLESYFQNPWHQDILATIMTFALALTWLRFMDGLAHRGVIGQKLSRKIIHIGTGPIFLLCWFLFSSQPAARFLASLVPLATTIQFFLVGIGWMDDPAAVKAMTRNGDRREILKGPLYYGIIFVLCTIIFWRNSPVGILALMIMCGGDGLADIFGRRWGKVKLPFGSEKSWRGSIAMFIGGFVFAFSYAALFNQLGYFEPPLNLGYAVGTIALISLITTIVEAFPLQDIDNITTTTAAIISGLLLL